MTEKLFIPKDSGSKRKFETGAQRDSAVGKGRCDLLPIKEVGELLQDEVLTQLGYYQETRDGVHIHNALISASENSLFGDIHTMILEASKLYEAGAIKYGENNWKRGMPTSVYLDSAIRHYLKTLRGDDDEPHSRGFVWNLLCLLWTKFNLGETEELIE